MSCKSFNRSAFTLIEILIATSILAAIVAVILWLTTNMLNLWERSSSSISSGSEARIAMDLLSTDLSSISFKEDDFQWISFQPITDELGPLIEDNRAYQLLFFSTPVDKPTETPNGQPAEGDLCAIQYRLAYKNPFNNQSGTLIYGLYRTVVDPSSTFEDAIGTDELATVWTSEFYGRKGDGKHPEEFLIGNVIEFFVEVVFEESINGVTRIEKSSLSEGYTFGPFNSNNPSSVAAPRSIQVTLTVLSDAGMKQLENNPNLSRADRELVITQFSDTFSTRIPILTTTF